MCSYKHVPISRQGNIEAQAETAKKISCITSIRRQEV